MSSFWPLFDLRITTARLTLRPPRDDDFQGLLDAIDLGVHDPGSMPFSIPWTDAAPAERRVGSVQHWWSARARWAVDDWQLPFAVFLEDRVIGVQDIFAKDFPSLREVGTGSWLALPYQGKGFGTEMRSAILEFAFRGLGALVARSSAFEDNPSSARVSARLGYSENGTARLAPRGELKTIVHYQLTREAWIARAPEGAPVDISGFDRARPMFGLPEA